MRSEKQTTTMQRVLGSHAQTSGSYSTCNGTIGGLYVGELLGCGRTMSAAPWSQGDQTGSSVGVVLAVELEERGQWLGSRGYSPIDFGSRAERTSG